MLVTCHFFVLHFVDFQTRHSIGVQVLYVVYVIPSAACDGQTVLLNLQITIKNTMGTVTFIDCVSHLTWSPAG